MAVKKLNEPFGVILLNEYAVDMTLNWLCNTNNMSDVHKNTLFVTLDYKAREELLKFYPELVVFTWNAKCLQSHFLPNDATYMSFFLFRTNLIRALIRKKKNFWMLQADTIWRRNLFEKPVSSSTINVALDQTGHEFSRKYTMNGANFLVFGNRSNTKELFEDVYWYQSRFYVTDPDVMKVVCSNSRYKCGWMRHRFISGWEWIYSQQVRPPMLIQMDGEVNGNKISTMKRLFIKKV
uniref:Nucleotide-diphospho-sugar transferase domain-containing protein n=1 Tax=Acrobeloides nanus TaxID=290746 RepID=A0A914C1G0_9BILA